MKRVFIKIHGIVQGVGFRPYVYNLAKKLNLKGWVNNNSEGVYVDAEGAEDSIESLIYSLKHNAPPLSKIEELIITPKIIFNYTSFSIKESEVNNNHTTLISPDIAMCIECEKDIYNAQNRRHRYPFTNCTNCGPRFTITRNLPYDRLTTTMKDFKMCDSCSEEYLNPDDRRFHAQPNACASCGPKIWATDKRGKKLDLDENEVISWVQSKLKEGKIFAVKGLGGFHLVCDGTNEAAIKILRERKRRPHKPFAIMMKDMDTIKSYCLCNPLEEALLTGTRKPIVILDKSNSCHLPENISPFQKTLGVMLPYTPLHSLLFFGDIINILIMTSGNLSGFPIEYKNTSAITNLQDVADYFLMHNRDILIPLDDSIVKVINNEARILRRARGYVPEPFRLKITNKILACGSNMKNTFCISNNDFLFLSGYNGDLENIQTLNHFKRNIKHFKEIFSFDPCYISHDIHPNYTSTKYAESSSLLKIPVQHHHAHIASCMTENNLNETVIGIAFDGTGYGEDKKIWGGEFFICNFTNFNRISHLDYLNMPGGEKAIKEPWRMAVSYVFQTIMYYLNRNDEELSLYLTLENLTKEKVSQFISKNIFKNQNTDCLNLINMIHSNINCIQTSSMGRFFDAVSSILGIRHIISYEGQASIELEALIDENCNDFYPYEICNDFSTDIFSSCNNQNHIRNKKINYYVIKPYVTIKAILLDILNNKTLEYISAKFHNTVVKLSTEMCVIIRKDTLLNKVVLSGGVFQNSYILKNLIISLERENFNVYSHKTIPTNDEGVSLGQIIIANEKLKSQHY